VLDEILERHVEQCGQRMIVAQGFDMSTVERLLRMFKNAEFKRKQAAPGLKVTSRAFGSGWRMPIVRKE
jgi:NAD+ synthase (glutamine-hydrolysing)